MIAPDDSTQRPVISSLRSLLLIVFLAQVLLASPANSAAFDEEYHFATGYVYLRTGDPRLSTEHPPLVNVWNALPLLLLDPKLPLDHPTWQNASPTISAIRSCGRPTPIGPCRSC